MIDPMPHDGFAKAAAKLRAQAATAGDPGERESLLASANRSDEVHARAIAVFSEVRETLDRTGAVVARHRAARRRRLVFFGFAFALVVAFVVFASLRN